MQKNSSRALLAFLALTSAAFVLVSASDFVASEASDQSEAFKSRTLKQADTNQESEAEKPKPMETQGPSVFYDEKYFLMRVTGGIVVHILGADRSAVLLNESAVSVKGSMTDASTLMVNIDWKSALFGGQGNSVKNVLLRMTFGKISKGTEYAMTGLEIESATVGNTDVKNNRLEVTSSEGYKVEAPIGTAYCCGDAGVFMPIGSPSGNVQLAVSFPGLELQVFDVNEPRFGPSWYCGGIWTIGLWIGLLTSLGFAIICAWGFSMLGSIQTMDRFDDPKGKPIHVPTSE